MIHCGITNRAQRYGFFRATTAKPPFIFASSAIFPPKPPPQSEPPAPTLHPPRQAKTPSEINTNSNQPGERGKGKADAKAGRGKADDGKKERRPSQAVFREWSDKRDLNPRPRPWQGRALPTELLSHGKTLGRTPLFCGGKYKCFFVSGKEKGEKIATGRGRKGEGADFSSFFWTK